jgi:ribosomal protein L7/L12
MKRAVENLVDMLVRAQKELDENRRTIEDLHRELMGMRQRELRPFDDDADGFALACARMARDDNKIERIKIVREITGAGLKEAKEAVERHFKENA